MAPPDQIKPLPNSRPTLTRMSVPHSKQDRPDINRISLQSNSTTTNPGPLKAHLKQSNQYKVPEPLRTNIQIIANTLTEQTLVLAIKKRGRSKHKQCIQFKSWSDLQARQARRQGSRRERW